MIRVDSYTDIESLVPDWTASNWLNNWANVKAYIKAKAGASGLPHAVMAYTHGATCVANAYFHGVLAPNNRFYLMPYAQSSEANWHYIDVNTGQVVAYAHGLGADTPITNAFTGGVLAPDGKIYLIPGQQSTQTKWHYINTLTSTVVAYAHGMSDLVIGAYHGGCLAPNGRIYMVPYAQSNQTNWHYINTSTGAVVSYAHGLGTLPVQWAYQGCALAPNGRIYLSPSEQADELNNLWHYIDTSTNTVVAYNHGLGTERPVDGAYRGGVTAPNGRVFLLPCEQTNQTKWHYIDTDGTVVAYTHGATCVATAYQGGVLAPNGRIYLVPRDQASQSSWHYIDPSTTPPTVTAYTHGATAVSGAYRGGALDINGRIWLVPLTQSNQTNWHYIDTRVNENWNINLCANPMFNKY